MTASSPLKNKLENNETVISLQLKSSYKKTYDSFITFKKQTIK